MRKYKMVAYTLLCLTILTTAISSMLIKRASVEGNYNIVNHIEMILDDEEILNLAEVVVSGEHLEKKDEVLYNNNGIRATVSIYSFDVTDCYLGDFQLGKEIFISYGGSFLPEELNVEGEKVMYLKKNILQYENQDVYSLVSVSQGVFTEELQMKNQLGYSFDVTEVQEENASR